jgi:hypothetical protein
VHLSTQLQSKSKPGRERTQGESERGPWVLASRAFPRFHNDLEDVAIFRGVQFPNPGYST